jgi:hypothetical protein
MHFINLTSRPSRLRGLLFFVLSIGTSVGLACGDTPATQPDTDDPPVVAAMAPAYIAVGKDLSLRLALVRRTLDDLTLDPPTRTQANDLLQACEKEVDGLIKQMENGPMPSSREVLGIPVYLRTQRNQLYQIIGTEQSQALDEMLRSLRGEGRSTLGHIRLALLELTPPPLKMSECDTVISTAEQKVEALPRTDLPADQYDAGRQNLDAILNSVRDKLSGILSADEITRLGPRFGELFPGAAQ